MAATLLAGRFSVTKDRPAVRGSHQRPLGATRCWIRVMVMSTVETTAT